MLVALQRLGRVECSGEPLIATAAHAMSSPFAGYHDIAIPREFFFPYMLYDAMLRKFPLLCLSRLARFIIMPPMIPAR